MITPLAGYVLIKQHEAEQRTSSGLMLADSSIEKPAKGEVISVGVSAYEYGKEITCPVEVGQTVIYKKWGGDDIEEFKLVKFEDLMAIDL